ncbi:kelch-like protein 34 [Corythoichthys intestinalis]|uniref:kelch-like protein 34 n=1 Tax=Corythoichthys intestinalis TaxID=161448 RepID=UPI0025A52523|nr:kelch-like protein 34 [Corythoichthys intestinalis]XP_061810329.1 kelch-like protein 34 [Nerophis lumbriciformis]
MDSYSILYSSSQRTELLARFQRLRSAGRMCDVVLETQGASFPCHRALLASSSDYFWALFGEAAAERLALRVKLPALTPVGLDVILDFLYSGWLKVSDSTLPDVLEAARYLQVETAVSICERYIMDELSAENCCVYANLAEHHVLPNVLEAAEDTVAAEMATLLQERREDLLNLNVQSMMAVLETEEIPSVKEVELVKLALDWLSENGPIPLLQSNLLLSRLRFGLVAPVDLTHLSHGNKAMGTPLIRSQVTRALEYHRMGSARPIRQSKQSKLRATDRVLLVGGSSNPDCPEQQVLAFNLKSRTFATLTSCLPSRLRNHCVCSLGGFLFVVGGELVSEADGKPVSAEISNHVWRYDPRFDCWQQVAPMLQRRTKFTCCVTDDAIHAIGGQCAPTNGDVNTTLASVEFYDLEAGAWRRGAPMPGPLYGHASAELEQSIYVSGGLSDDPGTDLIPGQTQSRKEVLCWDQKGRLWRKVAPMSIGRFGHRMTSVRGYIYALLGMYEPFSDIERYDPVADHWTRLRPLLVASFGYGIAATPTGSILVFGGRKWSDSREVALKSVLEYEPKKDQWREICHLPRPLTGTECTLLPVPD